MSKKEQLIENLKGFKAVYENMQEEKRTIEADPNYTPEGKFNAINGLMEKYAPTVQKYHDTANQIIESGIVALNKAWSEQITARLTDIGYQMGLQNTLEMFKNDLINRPEDAAAIIEVYRRDFPTALELIKKAALQGKEEKISFKEKKTRELPRNQWIVVEHTHEAIIKEEIFGDVKKRMAERRLARTRISKEENT